MAKKDVLLHWKNSTSSTFKLELDKKMFRLRYFCFPKNRRNQRQSRRLKNTTYGNGTDILCLER